MSNLRPCGHPFDDDPMVCSDCAEAAVKVMIGPGWKGLVFGPDFGKAVDLRPNEAPATLPSVNPITDYWYAHYLHRDLCSLCGNKGVIDTRGVRTNAGVEVGRRNYCICPNGQILRALQVAL